MTFILLYHRQHVDNRKQKTRGLVTLGGPILEVTISVHVMVARNLLAESIWQVWRAGAILLQLVWNRFCSGNIN